MFVLGLQGSPRTKGSSHFLLSSFLKECEKYGAKTRTINACSINIEPCKELVVCEKKGVCPLKDDMDDYIYGLIKKADIVVLASPVFFYNVTAQVKMLIDRCQMFWGRKYKLGLKDPFSYHRQGFLLSVGASGGKKLFDGIHLTARFFFDAISAKDMGSLVYRNIEDAKDIRSQADLDKDIKNAVKKLFAPVINKKTILFISRHDACRSQIAGTFARIHAKGEFNILTAGYDPADRIEPEVINFMKEKKMDLLYQTPDHLDDFFAAGSKPDIVINLDPGKEFENIGGSGYQNWAITEHRSPDRESLFQLGKEVESRVKDLVTSLAE